MVLYLGDNIQGMQQSLGTSALELVASGDSTPGSSSDAGSPDPGTGGPCPLPAHSRRFQVISNL